VLTGDFIFARAAKLAAETDHLPLMKLFAETLAIIVNGELTQLFVSRSITSRDDYFKRIYAKTASLLEMTTRAAAMISPVSENTVEAMRLYGYHLGMAFQIVDDVLDFTGEQSEVGKPVGSDLLQGLVTLPAIHYAEAHPDDPDIHCLTNGCYSEHERMERLMQAVRKSDGVEKSLEEARGFIEKALESLADMPGGVEHDALAGLARYTISRRS
jgi:geranylgeranyl pyrophosphate synthase